MKEHIRILSLATALLGALAATEHATAAITQYSDAASFLAATNSQVVEGFSGVTTGTTGATPITGTTIGGVAYSGGPASVVDPAVAPGTIDWGTGAVVQFGSPAAVTLTFAPTTAFAALFGSDALFPYDIFASIDGGRFMLLPTNDFPTLAYYGWTSDTPFSTVTIQGTESAPVLDNVTIATANAPSSVPEPATLVLVGIALITSAAARKYLVS